MVIYLMICATVRSHAEHPNFGYPQNERINTSQRLRTKILARNGRRKIEKKAIREVFPRRKQRFPTIRIQGGSRSTFQAKTPINKQKTRYRHKCIRKNKKKTNKFAILLYDNNKEKFIKGLILK